LKLIAITNHKGGSAKTTTTVNLAAALAELGRRVLVVDLDPQGSATQWLGLPLGERAVLDAYLVHSDVTSLVSPTTAPGVELVPATYYLVAADRRQETAIALGIIRTLERLPAMWDFVLIDCPPSHSSLAVAPLAVAPYVVVPVETRVLALSGIASLIGTMDSVRERLNPNLTLAGVIASRANRTRHARDVVQRLRERFDGLVFDVVVREAISLAEAPSFQLPITRYAPEGTGAADFRMVASELLVREVEREEWAVHASEPIAEPAVAWPATRPAEAPARH
jgi:chromosome partitioning protein